MSSSATGKDSRSSDRNSDSNKNSANLKPSIMVSHASSTTSGALTSSDGMPPIKVKKHVKIQEEPIIPIEESNNFKKHAREKTPAHDYFHGNEDPKLMGEDIEEFLVQQEGIIMKDRKSKQNLQLQVMVNGEDTNGILKNTRVSAEEPMCMDSIMAAKKKTSNLSVTNGPEVSGRHFPRGKVSFAGDEEEKEVAVTAEKAEKEIPVVSTNPNHTQTIGTDGRVSRTRLSAGTNGSSPQTNGAVKKSRFTVNPAFISFHGAKQFTTRKPRNYERRNDQKHMSLTAGDFPTNELNGNADWEKKRALNMFKGLNLAELFIDEDAFPSREDERRGRRRVDGIGRHIRGCGSNEGEHFGDFEYALNRVAELRNNLDICLFGEASNSGHKAQAESMSFTENIMFLKRCVIFFGMGQITCTQAAPKDDDEDAKKKKKEKKKKKMSLKEEAIALETDNLDLAPLAEMEEAELAETNTSTKKLDKKEKKEQKEAAKKEKKKKSREKTNLWGYPLASLFCHGGRVLVRLEEITAPRVIYYLLTGEIMRQDVKEESAKNFIAQETVLSKRLAATHGVEYKHNTGDLVELKLSTKSLTQTAQNLQDGLTGHHFGVDIPWGGIGHKYPAGEIEEGDAGEEEEKKSDKLLTLAERETKKLEKEKKDESKKDKKAVRFYIGPHGDGMLIKKDRKKKVVSSTMPSLAYTPIAELGGGDRDEDEEEEERKKKEEEEKKKKAAEEEAKKSHLISFEEIPSFKKGTNSMKQAEEDALDTYEKKHNIHLPYHFESTNVQCGHMYVRLDDFEPKLHHIGGHRHEFGDVEILNYDEGLNNNDSSANFNGSFQGSSNRATMCLDPSDMLRSHDAKTALARFTINNHGMSTYQHGPMMATIPQRISSMSMFSDASMSSSMRGSRMTLASHKYSSDPMASRVFFGSNYSPLAVLCAPLELMARKDCNSNHDVLSNFYSFHVGNNFSFLTQQQKKFFVNGFKKLLKEHYTLRKTRKTLFTQNISNFVSASNDSRLSVDENVGASLNNMNTDTVGGIEKMASVISDTADPRAAIMIEQLMEDLGVNNDIESIIKSRGDVDLKLPKMLWINRLLQSAKRPDELCTQKDKILDEIAQGELKRKQESSAVLARRFVRMNSSFSRFANSSLLQNAEDIRYVQLCCINARAKLGFFNLPQGHEHFHRGTAYDRAKAKAQKQKDEVTGFAALFGTETKEKTFSLSYLALAVLHYHIMQRFNHIPDVDFHADRLIKRVKKNNANARNTLKAKAQGIWSKLRVAISTEKDEREKGKEKEENDPRASTNNFLTTQMRENGGVNFNLTLNFIVELIMELQKRLRNTLEGEKLDKLLKQAGHGQNAPPSPEFMKQLSDYIVYILTTYVMSSPPQCSADNAARRAEEAGAEHKRATNAAIGRQTEAGQKPRETAAVTAQMRQTAIATNEKGSSYQEEANYILLPTPPSITALKYVLDAHVKRDHLILMGHQGGPDIHSLETTGLGEDVFGSTGGDSIGGTNLASGSFTSKLNHSMHVTKNEFGAKHLSHLQGGATESRARANIRRRQELAAQSGFNPYFMESNNHSNNNIGIQMRLIEHEFEQPSSDEDKKDDDEMIAKSGRNSAGLADFKGQRDSKFQEDEGTKDSNLNPIVPGGMKGAVTSQTFLQSTGSETGPGLHRLGSTDSTGENLAAASNPDMMNNRGSMENTNTENNAPNTGFAFASSVKSVSAKHKKPDDGKSHTMLGHRFKQMKKGVKKGVGVIAGDKRGSTGKNAKNQKAVQGPVIF